MATEKLEVYKCDHCGNIIEIVRGEGPAIQCCGADMKLMAENATDAAVEKHVPVIESIDGGFKVTVGSVNHPMQEDHYIEWIELVSGNKVLREYLSPGRLPEATFLIKAGSVAARAYCNLHGLWRSE